MAPQRCPLSSLRPAASETSVVWTQPGTPGYDVTMMSLGIISPSLLSWTEKCSGDYNLFDALFVMHCFMLHIVYTSFVESWLVMYVCGCHCV